MFHNINYMCRYIIKQETVQASLLIQGLRVNFRSTKAAGNSPATPKIYIPLQPIIPIDPKTETTVPEDLENIQPFSSQVCNCDKIGFDINRSWRKVVCTYKFFTRDSMWNDQTGEREPFCCTALIFTSYDVQCFVPPVIVFQEENCTQDLHYNIPKYSVVHNTPPGYMERDVWMKEMIHFKTVFGSKNQSTGPLL